MAHFSETLKVRLRDGSTNDIGAATPLNPAHVAAWLLLARALEVAGVTVEQAGRDGSVCVIRVPAQDWVEHARDAWGARMRHGKRFSDGQENDYWGAGDWLALAPSEEPRKY